MVIGKKLTVFFDLQSFYQIVNKLTKNDLIFQLINLEEKYVSVEEDALLTNRTNGQVLGCPSYSVDECYRVSSSLMHDYYNLVNV